MEVRCPSRIHAVLTDEGLLEVKCKSSHCGAGRGTVVLHYFDPVTWRLVRTQTFLAPEPLFKKER